MHRGLTLLLFAQEPPHAVKNCTTQGPHIKLLSAQGATMPCTGASPHYNALHRSLTGLCTSGASSDALLPHSTTVGTSWSYWGLLLQRPRIIVPASKYYGAQSIAVELRGVWLSPRGDNAPLCNHPNPPSNPPTLPPHSSRRPGRAG